MAISLTLLMFDDGSHFIHSSLFAEEKVDHYVQASAGSSDGFSRPISDAPVTTPFRYGRRALSGSSPDHQAEEPSSSPDWTDVPGFVSPCSAAKLRAIATS